jgi:flagellar M-ring protein FliF
VPLRILENQTGGSPFRLLLTRDAVEHLKSFWTRLDRRQRLVAGLGAVAIVIAAMGLGGLAPDAEKVLLYSGLDSSAAGAVIGELEADGVPFEVRDTSIFVDPATRDRIRMELAAKSLPSGRAAGYEILDGLSGFGTTSQMFDAAYWRAKEGELARTITASANVRAARVHLAKPVSPAFSRRAAGSASVTVTMARGQLDRAQAEAIRHLVSSAVADIAPDAVAVIDSDGGVILAGTDDPLGRIAAQPDPRAERMRASLQRMLEARVGEGRAVVEVNVEAVLDSETVSERTIDPDSRVAISSDKEETSENANGSDPGVTVASNLPGGDVGDANGSTSHASTRTREQQNFEVSETRRERTIGPGQVRRLSVAVMVDGIISTAADGTESWSPRPAEEVETLRQLVQSAIGFDSERGDVVTVESLQFTLPSEEGTLVTGAGSTVLRQHAGTFAQLGIIAIIVLALIVFVLRPLVTRRSSPDLLQLTGSQEASLRPMTASFAGGETLDLPLHGVTKIDRLRDVISSRTEESAAVLRSWIESPESRRETAGS